MKSFVKSEQDGREKCQQARENKVFLDRRESLYLHNEAIPIAKSLLVHKLLDFQTHQLLS